jgi:hypothetical protein
VPASIRAVFRVSPSNASNTESCQRSKQQFDEGGIIESLTVIKRTSDSFSWLASAHGFFAVGALPQSNTDQHETGNIRSNGTERRLFANARCDGGNRTTPAAPTRQTQAHLFSLYLWLLAPAKQQPRDADDRSIAHLLGRQLVRGGFERV